MDFIACPLEIGAIVRMNVLFVSFKSVEMLSRNEVWLDANILNMTPTVLSSNVNSCCKLVSSSRVGVPL